MLASALVFLMIATSGYLVRRLMTTRTYSLSGVGPRWSTLNCSIGLEGAVVGCQGSLWCVGVEAWHAAPVIESVVALVGEGTKALVRVWAPRVGVGGRGRPWWCCPFGRPGCCCRPGLLLVRSGLAHRCGTHSGVCLGGCRCVGRR